MNRFKTFFMSYILPWIPKRLLSRLTGLVMRIPLGSFSGTLIPKFAAFFKINISEAEFEPSKYRSFDHFFTRRLKPGIRPIQGKFVHPADSMLTSNGPVHFGQLVQAKGWNYSLEEFLGDDSLAQVYGKGSFVTYYLCPADYHRVHASADGDLISAKHIPGMLWPVNTWSVQNIKRLFNLNERVVLNFTSPRGRWSLVMVGATNVGYMSMKVDPTLVTKQWFKHKPSDRYYSSAIQVKAGDELGMFHLGSTVICIFEWEIPKIENPKAVKMGEAY